MGRRLPGQPRANLAVSCQGWGRWREVAHAPGSSLLPFSGSGELQALPGPLAALQALHPFIGNSCAPRLSPLGEGWEKAPGLWGIFLMRVEL